MSKKTLLAAAGLIFGLQSMNVMAASISAATEAIQKQDYATAIEDLKELIDEGNADATNLMGQLYENGWGVKQDIAKAKSLYDRGARQGNINSVNSLRKLKNIEYKVELDALMPKVKAGDASAQNRAGEMYEFGYGTERDGAMAFKLYQLAAKQGLVAAQHNLGRSFNFATGTEQNFEEAERWYRQAAKQGYTNSMFFLGTLYSNGYGNDSSHAQDIIAYAWMHNAAALGNGTAASIESRLLMKLQESQMKEAEALAAEYAQDYVEPFKN
ncbi:tetratricopeptide repeat protein [Neptunomonas sp.]|uniref:tetratricopeptide repeat protein n=1 Tax=Neptunomonas sp. TaxID=1971898 RepID=UPI00356B0177